VASGVVRVRSGLLGNQRSADDSLFSGIIWGDGVLPGGGACLY
jgi:hypothetical protein